MDAKESTKEKIISVACELFFTKGYEETRIVDIINRLDGLTKGAIYHYFDSKEDIFNCVVKNIGSRNIEIFDMIKNDKQLSGAEKLSRIVEESLSNENMEIITNISPNLLDNPKLLSAFIKEIKNMTIPKYINPIIIEGINDGSIKTIYPNELSEIIAVLLNLCLNPLIFPVGNVRLSNKMKIVNMMLARFNIKVFSDKIIDKIEQK